MLRKILRSKLHRATITHADVLYEGSISIPPVLLEAAGIIPYEAVEIWNVTNGNRLETYAIKGEDNPSSINTIAINGAAAHLCHPGDIIIIACFGFFNNEDAIKYTPKCIFLDEKNQIKNIGKEVPGPLLRN